MTDPATIATDIVSSAAPDTATSIHSSLITARLLLSSPGPGSEEGRQIYVKSNAKLRRLLDGMAAGPGQIVYFLPSDARRVMQGVVSIDYDYRDELNQHGLTAGAAGFVSVPAGASAAIDKETLEAIAAFNARGVQLAAMHQPLELADKILANIAQELVIVALGNVCDQEPVNLRSLLKELEILAGLSAELDRLIQTVAQAIAAKPLDPEIAIAAVSTAARDAIDSLGRTTGGLNALARLRTTSSGAVSAPGNLRMRRLSVEELQQSLRELSAEMVQLGLKIGQTANDEESQDLATRLAALSAKFQRHRLLLAKRQAEASVSEAPVSEAPVSETSVPEAPAIEVHEPAPEFIPDELSPAPGVTPDLDPKPVLTPVFVSGGLPECIPEDDDEEF